ncbi:MAG TPA: lysylphosphatidylglycerol synthase domain-containing protein, partial [Thermomicrobiaceae bacterium]|nr:lysylphosphatidylglycerol synthase domain-containing protein [Thermomicrobiaceae bacterium]
MNGQPVPDALTQPQAAGPRLERRRWVLIALAWGPVALVILAVVASGEASRVGNALSGASLPLVAALLPIGLLLPVVHARRWQLMLAGIGEPVGLLDAIEMTVTASMVNYAIPGYSGSPAKGALVRQLHGVGFRRSIPTLAAEQVLDVLALLAGSVIGVSLALASGVDLTGLKDRSAAVSIGAALALGVAALVIAVVLLRRFGRSFARAVLDTSRLLVRDRSLRLPLTWLTLVYWALNVAAVWVAAEAVGITLHPLALLLLSNLPLLLGLLSPLPGGIGVREGAMTVVAGALTL